MFITTKEEAAEVLNNIITEVSGHEYISNDSSLEDDLDIDSLEKIEIIIHCEREFNVEIRDSEIEHAYTVGQLMEVIWKKLS